MECDSCSKSISSWTVRYREADTIFCKDCVDTPIAEKVINEKLQELDDAEEKEDEYSEEIKNIILTTESHSPDLKISERLGIIASECVLGMNVFRDLFAGVSDVFVGQNKSSKKVLEDLKKKALLELKERAFVLGANAVVSVDLNYNELSGGGKSMLFLVASGTAVALDKSQEKK